MCLSRLALPLTFVFVALALHTQHRNDHHNDHNRSGRQGDHEPGLPVERLVLQITILQIQFRRGQYGVLGVHRERDAIAIVGDHTECICRRWHKDVIANGIFRQDARLALLQLGPT